MQGAAAALLATTATAWGQPGKAGGRGIVVAQIVDSSPAQQDLARDFLIGSRAACSLEEPPNWCSSPKAWSGSRASATS